MNNIFIQVLLLLSIQACGTAQDMVDPFDAEVTGASQGLTNMLGSNWTLTFNEDFNEMHQQEWYGVASISPDAMPENCKDGTVVKAGTIDNIKFENLEAGRHYFVRFCAQGAHKTSKGIKVEFDYNF